MNEIQENLGHKPEVMLQFSFFNDFILCNYKLL